MFSEVKNIIREEYISEEEYYNIKKNYKKTKKNAMQ